LSETTELAFKKGSAYHEALQSAPTANPTEEPEPSYVPTAAPTEESPTNPPTREPTEEVPSLHPTLSPIEESGMPTREPTEEVPSQHPTQAPMEESSGPTFQPTEESPSGLPTLAPIEDTFPPTNKPSRQPTPFPTVKSLPTPKPTPIPTNRPSLGPGETHSPTVSFNPTASPTLTPAVVTLESAQPMDGVTSSDFNSDPSTATAFCETVSGLLNVSYAVNCDIQNVANARRRLLDKPAPRLFNRMLQTPSIVIDYSLAFSIPNDGATTDAIANALAETAKNNLVSGVSSGAFNAAFQAQLAAFGITNPALLTASSTSVTTIVLVIIATYSPTSAPTLAPVGGSSSKEDDKYTTGGFLALWIILGLLFAGGVGAALYFLYFKDKLSNRNLGVKDPESSDPIEMAVHKSRRESYTDHTKRHSINDTNASEAADTARRSRYSFGVIPRFSLFWEDNPTVKRKTNPPAVASPSEIGVQEATNTGSPTRPAAARTINHPQDARTSFALYDSYDPPQA
jgi:hypothetical protein